MNRNGNDKLLQDQVRRNMRGTKLKNILNCVPNVLNDSIPGHFEVMIFLSDKSPITFTRGQTMKKHGIHLLNYLYYKINFISSIPSYYSQLLYLPSLLKINKAIILHKHFIPPCPFTYK